MKKSTRILALLIAFEACLGLLWWWLMAGLRSGEFTPSGDAADTAATLSSTIGGAMGVLAGVMLAIWFVLRRGENTD